jgi:phosphopantothenoylcysteine decarboxylase/phosphopantothenate--cysteine ligase
MILLGVSGSIAAYKAVELLRLLTQAGQDVRVVMTPAATHFVGPLTFQALSGHPVLTDTLDPQGWQMAHLDLPEKAAAFVLAPASAAMISQLAAGGAGDIIGASLLAMPRHSSGKLKAPVWIVPAMHEAMWLHPATQENAKTLKRYGYQFIGPERGALGRVGDIGHGRMVEPQAIAALVLKSLGKSASK